MKKKVLGMIAVAAVVAAASWNYQQKESVQLSDLMLENVEALARGEGSGGKYKYVFPGSDPSVKCVCGGSGSLTCC